MDMVQFLWPHITMFLVRFEVFKVVTLKMAFRMWNQIVWYTHTVSQGHTVSILRVEEVH
jgi:hypothetical protein